MKITFDTCAMFTLQPRPPLVWTARLFGRRRVWVRVPFTRRGLCLDV